MAREGEYGDWWERRRAVKDAKRHEDIPWENAAHRGSNRPPAPPSHVGLGAALIVVAGTLWLYAGFWWSFWLVVVLAVGWLGMFALLMRKIPFD